MSQSTNACCCPASRKLLPWMTGEFETPVGPVPTVKTALSRADHLGAARMRLDIGRTQYAIQPGLYAVGAPTPDSPVFVSANYKLSFDRLRQELGGFDAWILALDTKGINVWCAAGKGTFGTDEIVRRIEATGLPNLASHRTLIVPQLGAPGVAAHEVMKQSGFRVVYGPVRARDIPAFFSAGLKATPEMRRVRFSLGDRMALVPVELIQWGKYALVLAACLFLLAGVNRHGYNWSMTLEHGSRAALLVFLSLVAGGALIPMLLPLIPGRAFSLKGALVGHVLAAGILMSGWITLDGVGGGVEIAAWFLLIPAIAAFVAMNYTGASTYTSLSGVRREMRFAVPAQIVAGIIGLALWVARGLLA